jgi:CheY-like chemotaxis protein
LSGSVFWFYFPYCPDDLATTPTTPFTQSFLLPPTEAVNSVIDISAKTSFSGRPQGRRPVEEPLGPLRILVVDDSMPILKMIQKSLEKEGHQVLTAKNGARGLAEMKRLTSQSASSTSPIEGAMDGLDVVLMDLQVRQPTTLTLTCCCADCNAVTMCRRCR